jgi:hypothetical protein
MKLSLQHGKTGKAMASLLRLFIENYGKSVMLELFNTLHHQLSL